MTRKSNGPLRNSMPAIRNGRMRWCSAVGSGVSRRGFLNGAGLAGVGAAVGASIPFGTNMPAGLVPAALAQGAQAPAAPAAVRRARSHWIPGQGEGSRRPRREAHSWPRRPSTCSTTRRRRRTSSSSATTGRSRRRRANAEAWKLTVDGEVNTKLELTLAELKSRIPAEDLSDGAGMRRQRPLVLPASGARQPVDERRSWLRGMDRHSARRGPQGRRRQGQRQVHRPLRRRPAPVRRPHQGVPLPRHADPQGDGRSTASSCSR